jgi:hypothetical protein
MSHSVPQTGVGARQSEWGGDSKSFRGWYASGTCFEPKLYGWLRELVKLRNVFMADPATAKLLPA